MDKYRINYALHGNGEFFIEAPTLELAYEAMYQRFAIDNSLIVNANFSEGFQIVETAVFRGEFPMVHKGRVTTYAELRDGDNIEAPAASKKQKVPTVALNPDLFEFGDENDRKLE
jgi:hypothetical protein